MRLLAFLCMSSILADQTSFNTQSFSNDFTTGNNFATGNNFPIRNNGNFLRLNTNTNQPDHLNFRERVIKAQLRGLDLAFGTNLVDMVLGPRANLGGPIREGAVRVGGLGALFGRGRN